jgi:vacuolar-type H+-ATPase subunit F/Vma7
MPGGICAAVSEDIALGLSLAGVTDILVFGKDRTLDDLRRWYRDRIEEKVGVMILSRECGEQLSGELFERRVSGKMLPVTVIIPGEEEDRRAAELIKRAIGMDPSRTVKDQEDS